MSDPTKSAPSHRAAREKLKAEGYCLWRCGRKAQKDKSLCKKCAALHAERAKAARRKASSGKGGSRLGKGRKTGTKKSGIKRSSY